MWNHHASWESFLLFFCLEKNHFLLALDCHYLISATCMMKASQTAFTCCWKLPQLKMASDIEKHTAPLLSLWNCAAALCSLSLHGMKFLICLPLNLVKPVNCWHQKQIPVVCNKHNVYTYVGVRDILLKACLGNHCWIRQICAFADFSSAESLMPFVSYFFRVWDLFLKKKKLGIIVITYSLGNI